eukprot:147316-Rhodomonas_salina.1
MAAGAHAQGKDSFLRPAKSWRGGDTVVGVLCVVQDDEPAAFRRNSRGLRHRSTSAHGHRAATLMCVVTEVPFLDEMLTFCCGAEERAHRAAEQRMVTPGFDSPDGADENAQVAVDDISHTGNSSNPRLQHAMSSTETGSAATRKRTFYTTVKQEGGRPSSWSAFLPSYIVAIP